MKVLIIEDNARLAERVKSVLDKLYIVDIALTGEEGFNIALSVEYNVIILDLTLPDTHGLKVCQNLRNQEVATPILVLTAIDDTKSRVQLLECGADDYLTKPFESTELNARVAALIRRQPQPSLNDVMLVRDLEVDLGRRQVRRSGVLIPLRRKEFDILEYLVCNRGRAVSRQMIMNHAWQDGTDNWNNTVDVHIKHLRDKVDRPFHSPLIKTAYGIGYMVDDTMQNNEETEQLVK